jgi:hypothetical protein
LNERLAPVAHTLLIKNEHVDWPAKAIFDSVSSGSLDDLSRNATTHDGAAGHGIRRKNLHGSRGHFAGILIVQTRKPASGVILASASVNIFGRYHIREQRV